MKRLKFAELGLSEEMLKAVIDMGFEEASPIQSETIPHIMQGIDIIGQAQTGTGKTAAFAIPIIERLDYDSTDIQAIVMCPTRELVIQVTDEFRKLMKYKGNITVTPVYGGQEIERQFKALRKNTQIVIGTPGRTIDHIKRGTIKLDAIKFVVLDEADEMLDMGFRDDIEMILEKTPTERQTVMFSATMPEDIARLMKKHQNHPKVVDVTNQKINAPKIEQIYYEIQENAKAEALARLIDFHNIKLALVFCNTKNRVDQLVEVLKSRGYFAEGLHGDMNQAQREKVMRNFRNGVIEILVATDVAGRGLDVNDIEAVFNYDLPSDEEDYVHRIGRTGRAGKTGIAFTFIVGKQIYYLKRIEKTNAMKMKAGQVPSITDLDETRVLNFKNKIEAVINKGHLTKYVNLITKMMDDDLIALDIAAAMLKLTLDQKNESYDSSQTFEREFDNYDRNGGRGGSRDGRDRGGDSRDRNKSGHNRRNYSNRVSTFKKDDSRPSFSDRKPDKETSGFKDRRKKTKKY